MAEYIDRTELETDTEWSEYEDGFVSYSQSQIQGMPKADVIERSKIDKALKEMDDLASHKVHPISFDQSVAIDMCIAIIKRNIREVENV